MKRETKMRNCKLKKPSSKTRIPWVHSYKINSSKCSNLQLLTKSNSNPPNINQANLPLQDWQHFAEEHEESLIFLELLRYIKNLKEQRNTMKGKLKTASQSTNSYTGGEKKSQLYSQMLSVRFLAGEWLHVGRTAVSIIIMWPANRFLHNKKRPAYSLMNALINCNSFSYRLKRERL